jgi:hypothetical protein
VWWNAGDLAAIIQNAYADADADLNPERTEYGDGDGDGGAVLPKSVVLHMGTQEGPIYMNNLIPPDLWTTYVDKVVSAWVGVGMGVQETGSPNDRRGSRNNRNRGNRNANAAQKVKADSVGGIGTGMGTVPTSLVYYSFTGGVHSLASWGDAFTYGLPLMYAPAYPDQYRTQRNSNVNIIYPDSSSGEKCDCSSCSDADEKKTSYVLIIIILGCSLLFCVFVIFHLLASRRTKELEYTLLGRESTF